MNKEDIDKAFEGRWNYKCGDFDDCEVRQLSGKYVKELCRDFFEAGVIISYDSHTVITEATEIRPSYPHEIQIVDIERIPQMLGENDGFNKWWDLYDKKCGRKKCLEKWKKLTPTEKYLCLINTPAYVESTPDIQFRKNPLTYLNGECWNDEIIPHNGTNKPTKQDAASRLTDILIG